MRSRQFQLRPVCPPPLNLQRELLEVFVILDVRVHCFADDLGALLAILVAPFLVFFLDALDLFLLAAKKISALLQ